MDANGVVAIIGAVVVGAIQLTTLVLNYLRDRDKFKKLESIDSQLQDNTALTRDAADAAKVVAKDATAAAVVVANEAKTAANIVADKADHLAKQLNGTLTTRIHDIVKEQTDPIVRVLETHIGQDDQNMMEIRNVLTELSNKIK